MAVRPSDAVLEARYKRAAQIDARLVRIDWFIENVSNTVAMSLKMRVELATKFLQTKVVHNINRPVTKRSVNKRLVVSNRSKRGEFPKVDTSLLRNTIFGEVKEVSPKVYEGYVGTPLDYGLILETSKRLDRSFLKRTFKKERPTVVKILTGPIR